MSLRERAREAAEWVFRTGPAGESITGDLDTIDKAADAASDVWEREYAALRSIVAKLFANEDIIYNEGGYIVISNSFIAYDESGDKFFDLAPDEVIALKGIIGE